LNEINEYAISGFKCVTMVNKLPLKLYIIFFLLILNPVNAYAYIDPGILSVLVQSVFAVILGGITAWIITPWAAVKSFLLKMMGKNQPEKAGESNKVLNDRDETQSPE